MSSSTPLASIKPEPGAPCRFLPSMHRRPVGDEDMHHLVLSDAVENRSCLSFAGPALEHTARGRQGFAPAETARPSRRQIGAAVHRAIIARYGGRELTQDRGLYVSIIFTSRGRGAAFSSNKRLFGRRTAASGKMGETRAEPERKVQRRRSHENTIVRLDVEDFFWHNHPRRIIRSRWNASSPWARRWCPNKSQEGRQHRRGRS